MQVDQHNFHGLLHSAHLIERELRQKLAPLGIQLRQALVLDALGRMGAMSQSEIAAQFGITSASMSTMTDRLLAAGYITRNADPASRRRHILDLTDKGRALLVGISEVWTTIDETAKTILGKDAGLYFKLARRLRDGLGGTVPSARNTPLRKGD